MRVIEWIRHILWFGIKLNPPHVILGPRKMPKMERDLNERWAEKIIELHFESHPEELDSLRKTSIRR